MADLTRHLNQAKLKPHYKASTVSGPLLQRSWTLKFQNSKFIIQFYK